MSSVIDLPGLFYNGVDYSQLSPRGLEDASIALSNKHRFAIVDCMDGKLTETQFNQELDQINLEGKVITDAFSRALDRVLG